MERFFFDLIQSGGDDYPDTEGAEFSDLDRARDEAIKALGEMISDLPKGFLREMSFKVRNGSGPYLLQVSIKVELTTSHFNPGPSPSC